MVRAVSEPKCRSLCQALMDALLTRWMALLLDPCLTSYEVEVMLSLLSPSRGYQLKGTASPSRREVENQTALASTRPRYAELAH